MSLLEPRFLTTMHVLNDQLIHIPCIICSYAALTVQSFGRPLKLKHKSNESATDMIKQHKLFGVFDRTEQIFFELSPQLLIAKFSIYYSCLCDEKLTFQQFFHASKRNIQCRESSVARLSSGLPLISFPKRFAHLINIL